MTEQQKIELSEKRGYCKGHKPNFGKSYTDWIDWANSLYKQGIRQTKCEKCGFWFFPSEL